MASQYEESKHWTSVFHASTNFPTPASQTLQCIGTATQKTIFHHAMRRRLETDKYTSHTRAEGTSK